MSDSSSKEGYQLDAVIRYTEILDVVAVTYGTNQLGRALIEGICENAILLESIDQGPVAQYLPLMVTQPSMVTTMETLILIGC